MNFFEIILRFIPLLATIAIVIVSLTAIRWFLDRRWKDDPGAQFRFQFIMLALTFSGFLAIVVSLPIKDSLQGQLLSLIGILLSAAIALSSTTFVGNIMAGIMLKALRSARPGDFITVEDLTGRITEMGLLHTEIQTEFRDLVTVPNLYMVTHPMQVVRASGTIIQAEVSLGYDVPHDRVVEVLRGAAEHCGLADGFVQVRKLGDFSVLYRVGGLLKDVKSLISARSSLREAMLDALHGAGIEIVSPTFMNTRALGEDRVFIPRSTRKASIVRTQAEDIAFDKAEDAASVEKIRAAIEHADAEMQKLDGDDGDGAARRREELSARKAKLLEQLAAAEEAKREKDKAEKNGQPADD